MTLHFLKLILLLFLKFASSDGLAIYSFFRSDNDFLRVFLWVKLIIKFLLLDIQFYLAFVFFFLSIILYLVLLFKGLWLPLINNAFFVIDFVPECRTFGQWRFIRHYIQVCFRDFFFFHFIAYLHISIGVLVWLRVNHHCFHLIIK